MSERYHLYFSDDLYSQGLHQELVEAGKKAQELARRWLALGYLYDSTVPALLTPRSEEMKFRLNAHIDGDVFLSTVFDELSQYRKDIATNALVNWIKVGYSIQIGEVSLIRIGGVEANTTPNSESNRGSLPIENPSVAQPREHCAGDSSLKELEPKSDVPAVNQESSLVPFGMALFE